MVLWVGPFHLVVEWELGLPDSKLDKSSFWALATRSLSDQDNADAFGESSW